jgi:FkbM family methyltransferase|tara:strand:+ start:304 stop:1047 length:744 start_codon:yes stop_codon:yes gene_type:complete
MIKDLEFFFKNFFFSEAFLLKRRLKRALKKNYEKELSIISKFKNKKKCAVDVGVYRGIYSYKLSKEFQHVYAYEPNPLIYPHLEKNLKKIINNLTLKNYALSNTSGTVDLKIPIRTNSFFKNNVEELYKLGCATIHNKNNFKNYKSVNVKKIKLDEDLVNKNLGFIKIDVEGHEKEVIEGAINLIKTFKPVLLVEIEERHNKKPVIETINFIKQIGYLAFYCKNNKLNRLEELKDLNQENNFYFLPK